MAVKRELFPKSRSSKRRKTVDQRLRNVERTQAMRKPELKRRTFSLSTQVTNGNMQLVQLTGIDTGTARYSRIGNEIRVKGVRCRGSLGAVGMDAYLIQGHGSTPPVIGDFQAGGHAPFLTSDKESVEFVEWDHYRNLSGTNTSFIIDRFFTFPMKVGYNGPTASDGTENLLYLVLVNRTGANVIPEVCCTILYTDN